jgi:hypothetical protein
LSLSDGLFQGGVLAADFIFDRHGAFSVIVFVSFGVARAEAPTTQLGDGGHVASRLKGDDPPPLAAAHGSRHFHWLSITNLL